MLTSTQVQVVAFISDGEVYCPACVTQESINSGTLTPLTRYECDEDEEGVSCGNCGHEISEPHDRYFTVSFKVEVARRCDENTVEDEITSWLDGLDYVRDYSDVTVDEH